MKIALAAIAACVLVGGAALRYGITRSELGEWRAGQLPYPGAGFSSYDAFHLYRGGRFELQVLSPCTQGERDNLAKDTASVNLHVVITGPHRFHIDRVFKSVRVGSWNAFGRTFSPNEVWVLPSGNYEVRIDGGAPAPPVFRDRGALIYLERMEPVGPDLGIALSEWVGYGLLGLAAAMAIFLAVRDRTATTPN